MWYPMSVTVAAASEPVTLAQAKLQCRIASGDTSFDDELAIYIAAARAYVEAYTGQRLVTQTVAAKCDWFSDLARLPVAPLASVSSIAYVDGAGDPQTLSTDVYELRSDGLVCSIALKYGAAWPVIQSGSRLTVTMVCGVAESDIQPDILAALLLHISSAFDARESVESPKYSAIDALLANHRVYA